MDVGTFHFCCFRGLAVDVAKTVLPRRTSINWKVQIQNIIDSNLLYLTRFFCIWFGNEAIKNIPVDLGQWHKDNETFKCFICICLICFSVAGINSLIRVFFGFISSQLLDNLCNHTFSKLYLLLAQVLQSLKYFRFRVFQSSSWSGDNYKRVIITDKWW